jgi:hypothetical protein
MIRHLLRWLLMRFCSINSIFTLEFAFALRKWRQKKLWRNSQFVHRHKCVTWSNFNLLGLSININENFTCKTNLRWYKTSIMDWIVKRINGEHKRSEWLETYKFEQKSLSKLLCIQNLTELNEKSHKHESWVEWKASLIYVSHKNSW